MRTYVFAAGAAGLFAIALAAGACTARSWDGQVVSTGTFEQVLGDGLAEGQVPLAGIAEAARDDTRGELVAVGALEGRAGEVTIAGGDVWLSRLHDGRISTERGRGIGGKATMLVSTRVHEWVGRTIAADVAPRDVESFVRAAARDAGLDPTAPFPFRVDGELIDLRAHVIGDDNPSADRESVATTVPGVVARQSVAGSIVGFHAEGREGDLTPAATSIHAHVLIAGEQPLTAHVESVGFEAGSVLYLPAR